MAAGPYTGPGSAQLDLAAASPSNPASMFSETIEYTLVGRGGGLGSSGSNSNIDDCSFYFDSATGDGTFSCLVRWLSSTKNDGGSSGAGIMARSALANGARNVAVMLTDGNGVTFQWRPQDGQAEEAWPMSIAIGVGAPIWVQLNKKGHTWTVRYSQDGTNWYNPTSVNVAFPAGPFYIGLVATSHDTSRGAVDNFTNVAGFSPHEYVSIQP